MGAWVEANLEKVGICQHWLFWIYKGLLMLHPPDLLMQFQNSSSCSHHCTVECSLQPRRSLHPDGSHWMERDYIKWGTDFVTKSLQQIAWNGEFSQVSWDYKFVGWEVGIDGSNVGFSLEQCGVEMGAVWNQNVFTFISFLTILRGST